MHTFIRACIYYLSLLSGTKKLNFILLPFFFFFLNRLTWWLGWPSTWNRMGSKSIWGIIADTVRCIWRPELDTHLPSPSWWLTELTSLPKYLFVVSIFISLDMKRNTSFTFLHLSNQPPTQKLVPFVFIFFLNFIQLFKTVDLFIYSLSSFLTISLFFIFWRRWNEWECSPCEIYYFFFFSRNINLLWETWFHSKLYPTTPFECKSPWHGTLLATFSLGHNP